MKEKWLDEIILINILLMVGNKKKRLLVIGYSSFFKRRLLPSLKKNKQFEYCVCSKSNNLSKKNRIFFKDYISAVEKFKPDLVYISTINSLHYFYAKKLLNRGLNVIVDKPATTNYKKTNELLRIAKSKNLLFVEATLFNYHRTFNIISKLTNNFKDIVHVQSNLNHPMIRTVKDIKRINGDCELDMGPYAAAVLRLFIKKKIKKIDVYKNYFNKTNIVKDFYVTAKSENCTYFGNFGFQREYIHQIVFFTKDKIIYTPPRIFAIPPDKNFFILIKTKNSYKKIKVYKDDCIKNFFKVILNKLKDKKFRYFYDIMSNDAKTRDKISKFK